MLSFSGIFSAPLLLSFSAGRSNATPLCSNSILSSSSRVNRFTRLPLIGASVNTSYLPSASASAVILPRTVTPFSSVSETMSLRAYCGLSASCISCFRSAFSMVLCCSNCATRAKFAASACCCMVSFANGKMFTPSDTLTVPSPLSTIPSSLAITCTCICEPSSPVIVEASPGLNVILPSILSAASRANCSTMACSANSFCSLGSCDSSRDNTASGDTCSSTPVSESRIMMLLSESVTLTPLPSSYGTSLPLITYTFRLSCFMVAPCIMPVLRFTRASIIELLCSIRPSISSRTRCIMPLYTCLALI